jgi:hypothetical protein
VLRVVLGVLLAGACDRGDPPPQAPSTAPSAAPVRVTGKEKVGWDQPASDATRLARYRFIVYVDGVPADLAGVACNTAASINAMFSCSAALPKLSPGSHRLELAAEETDGQRRRGPKSGVLLLNVVQPGTSP